MCQNIFFPFVPFDEGLRLDIYPQFKELLPLANHLAFEGDDLRYAGVKGLRRTDFH